MAPDINKVSDSDLASGFVLNDCIKVYPLESRIERDGQSISIQPMEMRVLVTLAERVGQVVTKDEIVDVVWRGRAVSPEALTQKIHALRHHFGDKPSDPRFIETLPRIGNRLIASLSLLPSASAAPAAPSNLSNAATEVATDSERRGIFAVLSDLRKRNVFRVAYIYCAVGWLLTQVAETMADVLHLPELAVTLTVVFVILGFPLALVMAYALEIAPDGSVRQTKPNTTGNHQPVRRAEMALVLGVVVAVSGFLFWWSGSDGPEAPLAPSRYSIAVVPFENISPKPEDAYFGDGLTEDVRLNLGRRSSLVVAPRVFTHEVMQSGAQSLSVGKQLGVAWILTGTARVIDSRIRVTVSLLNTDDNSELWSEEFDVKTSDPMSLQVQMSQTIALTVAEMLDAGVDQGISVGGQSSQPDFKTYEAYLKGLEALGRPRSEMSLAIAEQAFRQAIESDSGFANGYVGLCETQLAQYIRTRETDFVRHSVDSCNRALELDSGSAQAHLALGKLYHQQGKFDLAKRSFEAAIELDAGLSEAYSGLGKALSRLGADELAEQNLLKALEMRPHWGAYNDLGTFMLRQGKFQKAVDNYSISTRLNKNNEHVFNNLGAAKYYLGDLKGAASAYRSSISISPSRAAYSNLGTMSYYLRRYSEAADNFERALEKAPSDYRLWGNMGDSLRFLNTKRPYDAEHAYSKAIELVKAQLELNPQDNAAWGNLAWYAANLGQVKLSTDSLRRALEIDEQDADTQYIAALVHILRDDQPQSLAALERARDAGYPTQIIAATPEFERFGKTNRFRTILASKNK